MPTHVTVSATDSTPTTEVVFGGQPGSLQAAPKFPLSLAATKDMLNFSNSFPSQPIPTLSVDIGPTDTTILLTSGNGAQLPLNSFEVSIDDEIIFVTARSVDSLTVIRGAESTTPANHFTGSNVQLLITAKSHNQVVAEVVAIEQFLGANGDNLPQLKVNGV